MNVADLIQPAAASPTAPHGRKRRRALPVLVTAAVIAASLIVWSHRSNPGATDSAAARDREEAGRTLAAFLAAGNAEERAGMVIGGSEMLPVMQAYYAGRELDPVPAGAFQPAEWSFDLRSSDLVALQLPRERGLTPVVACFRKDTAGQWLLDWDVWRQSMDGQFRDFMLHPAEGQHTMRVRLTHAPSSDGALSLEVSDPFSVETTLSLNITREDLAALYARDLPEGASRTATVQLVWLNDSLTGTLQAVLRRHVCWGYAELDGVEPTEVISNRVNPHRPPPAPAQETSAVSADDGRAGELPLLSAAPLSR